MAKRKAKRATRSARPTRKASSVRRSAKRPTVKKSSAKKPASKGRKVAAKRSATSKRASRKTATTARHAKRPTTSASQKIAKLDRNRRTLADPVVGPPSSLDMDRHGSAARTGRAELAENLAHHQGMTGVTGGDPDVDIEDAYFGGDEAPGGDNPTPDQDVVDDIGKALGVEYEDNEELKASEKVGARDKHRWELDPASSEDYKDRK
jgi:hypothetical protein